MDKTYLQDYRLSEVIALIATLSISEKTFRSNEGLVGSFRANAKSATDWVEIGKQHPEFFRMGRDQKSVSLLIRFLDKAEITEGDLRPPLTIDQTQKLIDQALELHDRQLARYQRNSFRIPIYAATITGIISIVIASIGFTNNSKTDKKIDVLTIKIDSLKLKH